jgi:hypothetical protein
VLRNASYVTQLDN